MFSRAPVVRGALVLVCVTILCYLSTEYFKLYIAKTQWYSLGDMLTPQVTTVFLGIFVALQEFFFSVFFSFGCSCKQNVEYAYHR